MGRWQQHSVFHKKNYERNRINTQCTDTKFFQREIRDEHERVTFFVSPTNKRFPTVKRPKYWPFGKSTKKNVFRKRLQNKINPQIWTKKTLKFLGSRANALRLKRQILQTKASSDISEGSSRNYSATANRVEGQVCLSSRNENMG